MLREWGSPEAWASSRFAASGFKTALALIAACALVGFFDAQWPRAARATAVDTQPYGWKVYGFAQAPLADDWSVPEIVRSVARRQSGTPILGVVVNLPHLNPSSVALYARLLTNQRAGPPLIEVRWMTRPALIEHIDECDYVLGLDGADRVAAVESDIEWSIGDNSARFDRVEAFRIPLEGAQAVLYRHERR